MRKRRAGGEQDDDSNRRLRAQGAPSRDVGLGRLPPDGRDVPAAARARGSSRRAASARGCASSTSRPAPATLDPRRPTRRRRHRQRPDPRAARGRPRARRGGGPRDRLGRGRRREPAVRGRVVRRRHVLDRRHVRAAPPGRGRRARARLPARRHDRPAELDAGGHARRAVPHDEAVRAAAPARRAAAAAVGRRGAPARPVRRPRGRSHTIERDVLEITAFAQPARLRRALQGLLRADDRRARKRGARGPGERVRRGARRVLRRVGLRHAGRPASRRSTWSPSARGSDADVREPVVEASPVQARARRRDASDTPIRGL